MKDFVCKCKTGTAIVLACLGCREPSESRASKPQASANVSAAVPSSSARAPAPIRIDPPAGPGSEAPNLFPSPKGPLLTWIENQEGKPSVRLARFSQGRWTNPSTVVVSDQLLVNWSDVPAVAEDSSRIFVAYPEYRVGKQGYHAQLAVSVDGGFSFMHHGPIHTDTSDTEHGFVAFAPENGLSVRVFWLDQRAMAQPRPNSQSPAPAMRLYTAYIGDYAMNEVLLDERTCDCCSLGAGRTDQGSLVAYRDRSDDEVRDISVVRQDGPDYSKPMPIHDDGYRIAGCPVNGPALATERTRVAIAWYTYAGEQARVKIAFSSDDGRHFAAPITIADSNDAVAPLGRVSVAWGDQGDAVLLYVEAEREKAQIVLRRIKPDGAIFAPLVVGETRPERKSGFPKMVRHDDQLLVVWTEAETPSHLRATLVPLAAVPRETSTIAPKTSTDLHVAREGDPAPAFEVQTLEGKPVSLRSLAGKPVLVNLWASYCEPCRQEHPVLAKIYGKYQKRGLEVVGIAMDERSTNEALKKLVAKRGLNYAIWLDPEDRAGRALGVRVLPATFLIDRQGTIVLVRRGALRDDDAELQKALDKL